MLKVTALALIIALCNAEKEQQSSSRLLLQAQGPSVPPGPPTQGTPALPIITQPTQIQPPVQQQPRPVQPVPQQPYNPYNPYGQQAYNPYTPSAPAYNPYAPSTPAYNPYGNQASCMMMGFDPQDCLMFGGMGAGGFGAHPGMVPNAPNYGAPAAARPSTNPYGNVASCAMWGLDPQDCMRMQYGVFW